MSNIYEAETILSAAFQTEDYVWRLLVTAPVRNETTMARLSFRLQVSLTDRGRRGSGRKVSTTLFRVGTGMMLDRGSTAVSDWEISLLGRPSAYYYYFGILKSLYARIQLVSTWIPSLKVAEPL